MAVEYGGMDCVWLCNTVAWTVCGCAIWWCGCVQGLQVGDEIVQFGSVSAANFVNMQSVATVVEHSKGVRLAAPLCSLHVLK